MLEIAVKIAAGIGGVYGGTCLLRLGVAWAEYGLRKIMPPKEWQTTIPKESKED